ncbi:MAG: hypothetical protein CL522_03845 [Actinobacteria bacterium]|nr:hypothetical protein [Actinomycetota bacterium]|tara:strand:- start:3374 stop:4381 length:1008 start_codon:yes stop_codon:yes gene_type:complete
MALSDTTRSFLTPEFIRNVRFARHRRGGYDIQEVDSFLRRFAELLESEDFRIPTNGEEDSELYDPEGAAQRLLAAAQRTADSLTKEAAAQAEQLIASAEAQADNIKRVVVEEARKMAEESQTNLKGKIESLESKRKNLEERCGYLEGQLHAGKDQLLIVLDEMRKLIEDSELELEIGQEIEELGEDSSELELELLEAQDEEAIEDETAGLDGISAMSEIRDIRPASQEDVMEVDGGRLEKEMPPELSLVHSTEDLESWIDAAAAGAEEGIGENWIEDQEDAGPPTQITPVVQGNEGVSGDRFFEELRDSDPHESVLGLVDDETDEAISSFFSDEE